jgi:hypothetical protein
MRNLARLSLLVLVSSVGCGTSTTGPSSSTVHSCGAGSFQGSMTAAINGSSFTATCLLSVKATGGILAIGGTDVSQANLMTFRDITFAVAAAGVGTFTLGPSGNNASFGIGGSQLWEAGASFGGSGTVTITAFSSTAVSGTFSFNLVAGPGGSGTKTITNGSFSITF